LFASKITSPQTSQNKNITGAYLIMLVVLLQIKIEKHLKSICSSLLSCYFEADKVKKYMQKQKHRACYR